MKKRQIFYKKKKKIIKEHTEEQLHHLHNQHLLDKADQLEIQEKKQAKARSCRKLPSTHYVVPLDIKEVKNNTTQNILSSYLKVHNDLSIDSTWLDTQKNNCRQLAVALRKRRWAYLQTENLRRRFRWRRDRDQSVAD